MLWSLVMVYFNGTLRVKVVQAANLRPARHVVHRSRPLSKAPAVELNPYIVLSIDKCDFAKTKPKVKTSNPEYYEQFETYVVDGQVIHTMILSSI